MVTSINDFQSTPRGLDPYGAVWVLTAPWAHPFWSQYAVFLYDLTTPTKLPPTLYRPDVTHEMMVWAIDPDKKIDKWEKREAGALLQPANHGYQFKAESDAAAEARIQAIVDRIDQRSLSPDTDFRRLWTRCSRTG